MLHLIASKEFEAFLSFEVQLPKLAGPDAPVRIEQLA
jgi:hypothetical protein